MVRFENVGMRYGAGPEVLRDVTFVLEAGSFTFLTGLSGAGKTTLLKLIYLAEPPSRGLITLFVLAGLGGLVIANLAMRNRAIYCPACRTPNLVAFVRSYRYKCNQCAAEYTRVGSAASAAFATYSATLDRPMPFYLYTPAFDDPSNPSSVTLSWGASAQLHQMPFAYDLDVNTVSTFDPSGAVVSQMGLTDTQATVTTLPAGHYFWRVTARVSADPDDDWQSDYQDQTVDIP